MGKIFAWDARIEIGTYGMPDTFHNFKYQLVPASYTVEGDHIDIKADSVAAHLYGVIDGPDHMTLTFDYQTDSGGTFSANCVSPPRAITPPGCINFRRRTLGACSNADHRDQRRQADSLSSAMGGKRTLTTGAKAMGRRQAIADVARLGGLAASACCYGRLA